MYGDAGIAKHGFRPGCRHHQKAPGFAFDWVADMPKLTSGLAVVDLEIGDHGVHLRVPVDQPFVSIDQPFAIELNEYFAHGGGEARIHREAFAAPIRRGAEAAQLSDDRAAGLRFPLPNLLYEFRAAQPLFVNLRLSELVSNDDLCGDAGMIGPRL